jgi:hypothetical protein
VRPEDRVLDIDDQALEERELLVVLDGLLEKACVIIRGPSLDHGGSPLVENRRDNSCGAKGVPRAIKRDATRLAIR